MVRDAIADDAVARAWDEPSVLEEQTVGGIAGHLARGGVWVVGDYLDADDPRRAARRVGRGQYFAQIDGVR